MRLLSHRSLTILSVGTMLFLLAACEPDIEKVNTVTHVENGPIETSRNVEMLYSDSALLKIKLTAPKVERFITDEPYLELTEGVKVLFYDSAGVVDSWLTANYAIRYNKKGYMEARNDVVVFNKKGEKLNTEHLIWDEQEGTIHTEEFVRITTADEVIYGKGMEADQRFDHYKIFDVHGIIKIEDTTEQDG